MESFVQRNHPLNELLNRTFKRIALHFLVLAVVFCGAMGQAAPRLWAAGDEVTVSAAISLKDVLDEISGLYRADNPGVTIHFNLGASGTLQRQIEEGAPVDLFISASSNQMDSLASHTLILADTRKDLVKGSIVLIAPEGRAIITGFQDLVRPEVKVIAIGDPQTVPAGKYAQEVLTHFGLYDKLKPKFVLAKDVRQVLTYVETGNADAGIVYLTDARTSSRVSVITTAPEDSHSPVVYPVAVIAGSKNVAAAKAFEEFLLGSKASAIFKKYGFVPAAR
jgi:molybdate transport system substrate-binding protein